jgi:hypothetical protein
MSTRYASGQWTVRALSGFETAGPRW